MSPRFAIVGHPNKGKSSIVATLAQDDSVPVSPLPGTNAAGSMPGEVMQLIQPSSGGVSSTAAARPGATSHEPAVISASSCSGPQPA